MRQRFFNWWSVFAGVWLLCVGAVTAAEPVAEKKSDDYALKPRMTGRGGFVFGAKDHNFYVESQWQFPVWARDGWFVAIEHRDTSPFLDTGGVFGNQFQVEHIHATESLRVEKQLNPSLSLKTLQRYQHMMVADRVGKRFGFESLFGIGTPDRAEELPRLQWEILAGPAQEIRTVDSDWALIARASWRVWDWDAPRWAKDAAPWGVSLDAEFESSNDGGDVRARFEAGPTLRFATIGGSEVDLFAHWIQNTGNPYAFSRDHGVFAGVRFDSRRGPQWGHDWLDFKAGRLMPFAWGRHELGVGHDNTVTMFETGFAVAQFNLVKLPTTVYLWYQHRQEFREGDFDNTSYSVFIGPQTPVRIPLVSEWLARDEPLIVALDYFHRSDHGLDVPAARLTPGVTRNSPMGRFLIHGSVNIWRMRLQTAGYDAPYRYKSHYERDTRWLGVVDWRVMLGGAGQADRARGNPAFQIAAEADIASIEGVVLYSRGLLSWNEESPDSYIEVGVKRPTGKIFWRYETYGIRRSMSRGGVNYFGIGLNL